MENLVGEALLGAVGIDAFLSPGPLRVTRQHREDAAALPKRMRRELRRFLAATEFPSDSPLPEFQYERALELLTDPAVGDAARIEEKIGSLDDMDVAVDFARAAGAAIAHLQGLLPKRARVGVLGPKPSSPSEQEISRFRRAYVTVQDPMTALVDLNEGALSTEQVRALEAVYPSLYEVLKREVFLGLTDLKAARPNYEMPRPRERQLERLLQSSTMNASLLKSMQDAFSAPDANQEPGAPLDMAAAKPDSPLRRIEAR